MDISQIIGLIMATLGLSALIVLLFIITIPLGKIEQKERKTKTKLYKTITKYLETLMGNDTNEPKTND